MKRTKLDEIEILDIGNTIQLTGAVYSGKGKNYLVIFPNEKQHFEKNEIEILDMNLDDWQKFLRQTDLKEVEILEQGPKGITKAIVRKSQRQIDAHVIWLVFRRDDYSCMYCGKNDVPLTIDHLVLWEEGGPTVKENLVTSCKKCNRTRGNTKFDKWIKSKYYQKVSEEVSDFRKKFIRRLWEVAQNLDKVKHIRNR